MPDPQRVTVYSIPSHCSFADALASGLIAQFGRDPLGLAKGRILLPNNRAVRALTDAFVRASGTGLLLPRLIPVGDPDLGERLGGGLDAIDGVPSPPPAIDTDERLLRLASLVPGDGVAERLRLAAELARTLDALLVEEIDPKRLRDVIAGTSDLARHWEHSLARLQIIYEAWPKLLAEQGAIDLAQSRNLVLRQLADRWEVEPPSGFTVAAGITTAAPAVTNLLSRVARMRGGSVVLPGLWLADAFPDAEWDALDAADGSRSDASHPQFHLKLVLERLGIARAEVQQWPWKGRAASSPLRTRAIANAMAAPEFSHKWETLSPPERRLTGIRVAELADSAAEAQAIAIALREVLETPGKTAALITPDRQLAGRVSALLARWEIEADDSAGKPLAVAPAGTLLLAIASAAAEQLAPVPLLALLKHPLVGGTGSDRLTWLGLVRDLDIKLRGPRPAAGLKGLDKHLVKFPGWETIRDKIASIDGLLSDPISLAELARSLARVAEGLCGENAWRGPAGRLAAELLADLEGSQAAHQLMVRAADAVPLLRQLLEARAVRAPYGGHPRIAIWGLLEARLQRPDFVVLGGLNEGTWPTLPAADPWLPAKVRAALGVATVEARIGLAAHDFASALGAPEVLITRARRDSRSPTVASRFLLRLNAICGRLPRHLKLERLTRAIDDPGPAIPVDRPAPTPPASARPQRISVTQVDRLKADPFAFYAQAILKLRALDPVDSDHTAAWKGIAVHLVFQHWLEHDDCDPEKLRDRATRLLVDEAVHPMLRALWGPRLLEAMDWIAAVERENRSHDRRPLAAERTGEAVVAGVAVYGRADRIDRLSSGELAIVDYKTGAPPTQKAVDAGFALQLGLLGLIAKAGGFDHIRGEPTVFEYWSLARLNGKFGRLMSPAKDSVATEFLDHARANFSEAVAKWLKGSEPFTAKLNPAYAPFGDYDQLMRLEEWYGR